MNAKRPLTADATVVYIWHMDKIRMNVYLLARQVKRLEAESKKTGSSVAELIRRAIDATYPEVKK